MGLFKSDENRVKCGRCGTDFDLIKNENHCPLCGFGKEKFIEIKEESRFVPLKTILVNETINNSLDSNNEKSKEKKNFIGVPPLLKLDSGKVISDKETRIWGPWLMFNDFFAPKFLTRVLAWKMHYENSDYINLKDLMEDSIELIKKYKLSNLKGFPNLDKDPKGSRLVYHFLGTFVKMGLVEIKAINSKAKDVWKEKWNKIKVALTKEGLEFARLSNPLFDEGKEEQVLSSNEIQWLINYLKKIDKENYKEYSVLKEVFDFLKSGKNGNKDLWEWFEKEQKFQAYIKRRSVRARNDPTIYKKQLKNYARTFASAKISLLRELGIIKNKRNDYTIIGKL